MELGSEGAARIGKRGNSLHITEAAELQRFQPSQDRRVAPPGTGHLWMLVRGLSFGDGLSFDLQVDRGVAVGGVDTAMAEPLADGHQVNAGFEEIDGRAVPHTVWMQTLVGQRWTDGPGTLALAGEDR